MVFYSHKNKSKDIILLQHLEYVGKRSQRIVESKYLTFIEKNVLAEISYLIGISHDFGKYTTYFQEKLDGLKDDQLTFHGLISALFSYEVVKEYLRNINFLEKQPYKLLPLIAFFIVKHHHSDLSDFENDFFPEILFYSGFSNISKQTENIFSNIPQIKEDFKFLFKGLDLSTEKIFGNMELYKRKIGNSDEIENILDSNGMSKYINNFNNNDVVYYLLVQFLYSVLIDSDKKHAGNVRDIERKEIADDIVERHIKTLNFQKENKSKINSIRNKIRESVLKKINANDRIFTLTAPTGTGKTLTSLNAALKLRKLLKNNFGLKFEPRIIYSLPFTSIIDQSFDNFDEIFKQIDDFEKYKSEYLLKHHHLSEVFYKTKEMDKEKDVDESLALIESWESEIIVTTFIQLFYTLIGHKNRSLKKFHNILNSIIILDEVQNIPIKYWKLVRYILVGLTQYFDCRVILMTATKPLIFDEGEFRELVENYEEYFKSEDLNRVTLKLNPSKTIDEFFTSINDFTKNSYLFVFNTIMSSYDFFNKIKEKEDFKTFYLSTNIIPKERKKRIEDIKDSLKNDLKIIVVSTQIIEAGVDIDCECAFRDLGPLDSIIQVAGRCNRNKRLKKGIVTITHLKSENGKYGFTNIYDPIIINETENIFKYKRIIQERNFIEIIYDYFISIKKRLPHETDIIDSVNKLCYKNDCKKINSISKFHLIEEALFKKDVFIEIDEDARQVWEKFKKIRILPVFERKSAFLKIKKDFYDYVISVPKKCVYETEYENTGIVYIGNKQVDTCYDDITGWIRGNESMFC